MNLVVKCCPHSECQHSVLPGIIVCKMTTSNEEDSEFKSFKKAHDDVFMMTYVARDEARHGTDFCEQSDLQERKNMCPICKIQKSLKSSLSAIHQLQTSSKTSTMAEAKTLPWRLIDNDTS